MEERKLHCCWCGDVIRPAREGETGDEPYICDQCRASVEDEIACQTCGGSGVIPQGYPERWTNCPDCTPEFR